MPSLLLAIVFGAAGACLPTESSPGDLLRTEGGAVLRGSILPAEGGWWVSTEDGKKFVAADDVAWMGNEADLRAEAERLLEGAGKGTAGATRHAQVAIWCADAGIPDDGYRILDRAVALDPAAPAVARSVTRLAAALAAEVRASRIIESHLLRLAAGRNGGRRLVAEAALGLLDPDVARDALLKGLGSSETPVRRFAAAALGDLCPGEGLPRLASAAVVDADEAVRACAFDSLRKADGKEACAALAPQLLAGPTYSARRLAAEALGKIGEPAAVPALAFALRQTQASAGGGPRANVFFGTQRTYIQDFDVQVAQAAAIGEPVIGVITEGAVLDARVLAVRAERFAIVGALRTLTGANFGEDAAAWEGWYRARSSGAPVTGR